nr:MAG: wsv021-like protein [Metapenaeopsis lamellata majanivirus]
MSNIICTEIYKMKNKSIFISALVEGCTLLLLMVVLFVCLVLRYNKRNYKDIFYKSFNLKKYPVYFLERNKENEIIMNMHKLDLEEYLLFTMLFRYIREFQPLTCKDNLGWYHYVYHITGCVFREINSSTTLSYDSNINCDSTTYVILNILSSYEINQLYVDYVFKLKKGIFDIRKDTNIRGDSKWLISNIHDLLEEIPIVKKKSNI